MFPTLPRLSCHGGLGEQCTRSGSPCLYRLRPCLSNKRMQAAGPDSSLNFQVLSRLGCRHVNHMLARLAWSCSEGRERNSVFGNSQVRIPRCQTRSSWPCPPFPAHGPGHGLSLHKRAWTGRNEGGRGGNLPELVGRGGVAGPPAPGLPSRCQGAFAIKGPESQRQHTDSFQGPQGWAASRLPGPEQQPRDLEKGPQWWGAARTPTRCWRCDGANLP